MSKTKEELQKKLQEEQEAAVQKFNDGYKALCQETGIQYVPQTVITGNNIQSVLIPTPIQG